MKTNDCKRKRLSAREAASCKSRKETLMRKAGELETLCDAKVLVLCYDCDGKLVDVHPDEEDKAIALITEYKRGPKSTRNKEANVWDSLGSDGVKKLMEEKNKGNFDDDVEEESVMLADLPGDSLTGFWRDLETKRLATEEQIRLLKGKSPQPYESEEIIGHGDAKFGFENKKLIGDNGTSTSVGTWSPELRMSTGTKFDSEAVDNPNLVGFIENISDLGHKSIHCTNFTSTNTSTSAAIWPWGTPFPLKIDDGHQSNFEAANNLGADSMGFEDFGANAVTPLIYNSTFPSSTNTNGGSSPSMPLIIEDHDDHQLDLETANYLETNLMGFENWAANNNAEIKFPLNTNLGYDLWQGTSVSNDNIGWNTTSTTMSNQNRHGTMTTDRCHQPVISPLHEMLPFSFWGQPSQV